MFEKQYGDREGIEDVIVGKRRLQYEEVKKNPLCLIMCVSRKVLATRIGSEKAIANVPPAEEKRYWQQYIYLEISVTKRSVQKIIA